MKPRIAVSNAAATKSSCNPTVLTVSFPYAAIGTKAVGGAEVLCSLLESSLASAGFHSIVVANADSNPSGRLYPTCVPDITVDDALRAQVEDAHQRNIDRAIAENEVALVHMHGFDFHRYRVPNNIPVLVTLHLPPSWYPDIIWSLPLNYHLACVSESQRASCPETVRHRIQVIPNGVPLPDMALLRDLGRYSLMLSRICPEKNLHVGFDASRLAGMPALLGGTVFPYAEHQKYFDQEIVPRLSSNGHEHQARPNHTAAMAPARFLGPVIGAEKDRLLSRAACLLLPSLAPETSSLVAMEALSFGVPVIGTAVGAVPEIVTHGRTGYLIHPEENAVMQMADALARLPQLDRKHCRAEAEDRFQWRHAQDRYLNLYRELISLNTRPSCAEAISLTSVEPLNSPVDECVVLSTITSKEAFEQFANDEWITLWKRDTGATPFQHPAWLFPWWKQFGPDGELKAVKLCSALDGTTVGFFPFYLYADPKTTERKLLLVGAGTTDYLDGLCLFSDPEIALQALTYMQSSSLGWDAMSLDQVRPNSPLARAASILSLNIEQAEPTSVLDLTVDLPSKLQNNIRRYRRIASSQGTLQCRIASDPDHALHCFEALVALHTQRWQARGEAGVLQDPRVLAHHRASLPLLLEAGLLCMFQLLLENRTIGVLYGLIDPPNARDRRLYLYLIGFDSQFAAISPGTLLLDEACRYASSNGCTKADLLRGGEAYKKLWGAQSEITLAIRTTSKHPSTAKAYD